MHSNAKGGEKRGGVHQFKMITMETFTIVNITKVEYLTILNYICKMFELGWTIYHSMYQYFLAQNKATKNKRDIQANSADL
jgi:hypothetical protein